MSLARRSVLAAVALAAMFAALPAQATHAPITIFAAASLKNALDAVTKAYSALTGEKVVISYAASGALAKQIAEGAPADVFITADTKWMDWVAERDLVTRHRKLIAANALVLIVPADSAASVDLKTPGSLAALVGDSRLAVGEPKTVPAGDYAQQSLTSLGLLDEVKDRLAAAESVRAALALVATGEAAAGIVYATDARVEPDVKVLATFPDDSHKPIVYPAAVVRSSNNPEAGAFVDYLVSPGAQSILIEQGFLPAPAGG